MINTKREGFGNVLEYVIKGYLYSHVHIALCTVFLYLFTMKITGVNPDLAYTGILFSGSIFLYSLHRLIGIEFFYTEEDTVRFNYYRNHKGLLYVTLFLSGLMAALSVLNIRYDLILGLMVGVVVGALYAVPVFGGRRLRDMPYIKIFLIAFTWTYLTVLLPLEWEGVSRIFMLALILERFFFFLAITLPFDIRDMEIDANQNVGTIPLLIGKNRSILLAILFLILGLIAQYIAFFYGYVNTTVLTAWGITYIISALLIVKFSRKADDFYFTGYLDGTMLLPYLFYVFLS